MVTLQSHQRLNRMQQDIVKAAAAAGVPYNGDVVNQMFHVYGDFFATSPVSFRTTTKPVEKRDLAVRYINLSDPHDPYAMALEAGFIVPCGHPIERVVPELQARYPKIGYGVDFGVGHGFEKIWPLFPADIPLENIYTLTSLPEHIQTYASYFRKYGFKGVNLMALDFRNRTFNLYFIANPNDPLTPERVKTLFLDAKFDVPAPEELAICAQSQSVYYTFSWDSKEIERVCMVMVGPQEVMPTHLDPVIAGYVEAAPSMADSRIFFVNPTYARQGKYVKIEVDYTGTFSDHLRRIFTGGDKHEY